MQLDPSPDELRFAAEWTMRHDPSVGFRSVLCQALNSMGVSDADDWLPPGL